MIGLLPAAGQATRMNGLPKYLLPIPGSGHLMQRHIEAMKLADCKEIFIGANRDNSFDLDHQFGLFHSISIYEATRHHTMSETVLSAREAMRRFDTEDDRLHDTVLFGMPDTYIEDALPYIKLADVLNEVAYAAVGLFRARPGQYTKVGMCLIDGNRVTKVIDKPAETDLEWLWGVLAWQPAFWEYIKPEDPHVGYAIPRAIAAGLDVRAVKMDGRYWDCGTPEEYFECIRAITSEA